MVNSYHLDYLGQHLVKSVCYKLVCLLTLLCAPLVAANQEQANIDSWSVGVNVGIGQRSAFITGQDDLDIYLLPDFYYYGEQFFIDNGTVGYTFLEQQSFAISLIAELNPYGLYFEQSALGENFNALYLLNSSAIAGEAPDDKTEELNSLVTATPGNPSLGHPESPGFGNNISDNIYHLPKPGLSADIGLQGNWFLPRGQNISLKLMKEISNKHSGFRVKFNWSLKHQISQLKLTMNLGFDWLDASVSSYYFGISPTDDNFKTSHYQAGSNINPFISLSANYPITRDISLVAHFKYLKLDSAITNSPLTNQSYSVTHFAGIHYKFW